jgi:hypothetical protein
MNADAHSGFIVAAYIAGVSIIAAMIVLTILDYAILKKTLARLTTRAGTDADRVA